MNGINGSFFTLRCSKTLSNGCPGGHRGTHPGSILQFLNEVEDDDVLVDGPIAGSGGRKLLVR